MANNLYTSHIIHIYVGLRDFRRVISHKIAVNDFRAFCARVALKKRLYNCNLSVQILVYQRDLTPFWVHYETVIQFYEECLYEISPNAKPLTSKLHILHQIVVAIVSL